MEQAAKVLGLGVMEYWSIGVLMKLSMKIVAGSNTPSLRYSNGRLMMPNLLTIN